MRPARETGQPVSGRIPFEALASIYVLLDAMSVFAAGILSHAILPGTEGTADSLVTVVLSVAVLAVGGAYRRDLATSNELRAVVTGVSVTVLGLGLMALRADGWSASLFWIVFWGVAIMAIVSARMTMRTPKLLGAYLTHPVVVVGERAQDLVAQAQPGPTGHWEICGTAPSGRLALMREEALAAWISQIASEAGCRPGAVTLLLAPGPDECVAVKKLATRLAAMGQPFAVTLPGVGVAGHAMVETPAGMDATLTVVRPNARHLAWRWLKRSIDLLLASLALVVLAPLLGIISLALVCEGGPVFFSQTRIGRNMRRFRCHKFRTMRPDAEDRLALLLECNPAARREWEAHQKLTNDPRITPFGRLLRASSLDELPQLVNILLGDMSIVGPRPIIAPEIAGYASDRAYFESDAMRDYAACTPGLTGLWQVSGRHRTVHSERIRLDRWYAHNMSVWLDLSIMLRTVRVVLQRTGG